MLRVLVFDQHPIVRAGIRALADLSVDWSVCAEIDGWDSSSYQPRVSSDLVILDPDHLESGAVLQEVIQMIGAAGAIIFTQRGDARGLQQGLAAGAIGYVLKADSVDCLQAAIQAVGAGRTYISSSMAKFIAQVGAWNGEKMPSEGRCTPREIEIVNLVADGLFNKQIASRLGTSLKTVESHRASAMRKLGAHSTAELIRAAMKGNLVSGCV